MFDLYSNIENLAKNAGYKNITALCKAAGIPRSTMTELKKGRTQTLLPETANKLADALHVSLDKVYGRKDPVFLPVILNLFGKEEKPAAGSGELSGEQQELISLIPDLSPEEVSVLLSVAKAQVAARQSQDKA